jgi:DeoR family fructose operon transcriptional repressor
MLTKKRYDLILSYLNKHTSASVSDLVNITSSSEATVRRDLTHLEEVGQLTRVHGGATIDRLEQEATYSDKSVLNLKEKIYIGKLAASLIDDGDTVFIDAGTTTYEMLPFIDAQSLTVVTNNMALIDILVRKGYDVYLLGGKVKSSTRAIVGHDALNKLQQLYFDKCFVGTNSVDISHGFSTPNNDEAYIKGAALKQAKQRFVLADDSKFYKTAFVKFGELKDAAIITNKSRSEFLKEASIYTNIIGGD